MAINSGGFGSPGVIASGLGGASMNPSSYTLPNSFVSSMAAPFTPPSKNVRVGEGAFWSTVRLNPSWAASTGSNRSDCLFVTPFGQIGQGFGQALDISKTNIKEYGRLGVGTAFTVTSVTWTISSRSAHCAREIYLNGSWAWDFSQARIDGGLLTENGNIGDPNLLSGRHIFAMHPIHLPADRSFNIVLLTGDIAEGSASDELAPVDVKFTLHGTYANFIEIG